MANKSQTQWHPFLFGLNRRDGQLLDVFATTQNFKIQVKFCKISSRNYLNSHILRRPLKLEKNLPFWFDITFEAFSDFMNFTTHQKMFYFLETFCISFACLIFNYTKVASSSMSRLVAHSSIISRLVNGKFDAYVL